MFNKELLTEAIIKANGVDFDTTPTIDNAKQLFVNIKKEERRNNQEKGEAINDLIVIFDFNPKTEFKGLTLNKLYLLHQSKMVNAIYELLRNQ